MSYTPVKIGDSIELEIIATGNLGDPIGKVKGFAIFVKETSANIGDIINVRITKVFKKCGIAIPEKK